MNSWNHTLKPKLQRLGFFLLCGGLISTYRGKDVDFDLLNYHYYNPWAFLHGRLLVDGFPSLQAFLNPVVDLPFFFAAKSLPDYITVFLMGMPLGWGLYILWNLLGALDRQRSAWHWLNRTLACFVAITGAACFSQANSPTNEILVAALVLCGMFLSIRTAIDGRNTDQNLVKVGLCLGLAAGLKLTSVPDVLAVSISLPFLLHGRLRLGRALIPFGAATAAAFLLSAGPWMWKLYVNFHSPMFPFFNSVFPSPLLDTGFSGDQRFIAHSLGQIFSFPLQSALIKNVWHSELALRDPRLLIGGLISLLWIIRIAAVRLSGRALDPSSRIKLFLAITFMAGYAISMMFFGVYRYLVLEEFLAAIMAFVVLADLMAAFRAAHAIGLALLLYVGCFVLTVVPDWGVTDATGGKYFHATPPRLPKDALIIDFSGGPVDYLLPQWPGHPAIINPISPVTTPGFNDRVQEILTRRIYSNSGPVYLLLDGLALSQQAKHLMQVYQLTFKESQCLPISGSVAGALAVCPTERTTESGLNGFDYQRSHNTPFFGGYFPVKTGDGVWIGPRAFINFSANDLARHRSLLITGASPLTQLPSMHSLRMDIYVNGALIKKASVSKAYDFSLLLPTELILSHADKLPVITVDVRMSGSVIPARLGLNPDVRNLSAIITQAMLTD